MATKLLDDPDMAKNRSKPDPPKRDQKFLVIQPAYLDTLRSVKTKDGRPMNVSAMMALEMYFRAMGLPFEEQYTGKVDELVGRLAKHK